MVELKEFGNEAHKGTIMQVHALVSATLVEYLENRDAWYHRHTGDERWLDREEVKEALRVMHGLGVCLDRGVLDGYLEQLEIVWVLLHHSKAGPLVYDQVAKTFGPECFFLKACFEGRG